MEDRKIWLVDFPTYQYNENVKTLAMQAGLKIIDSKHSEIVDKELVEEDPPKLTKKKAKVKSKTKAD